MKIELAETRIDVTGRAIGASGTDKLSVSDAEQLLAELSMLGRCGTP